MRINCIPVEYLADQHLRAEWVEILMLPAYIKRSLKSKLGIVLSESNEYSLNTGHARFFYDKLGYVIKRYKEIEVEMNARGFNTVPVLKNLVEDLPIELFKDWTPTEKDMINNLHRILTRIDAKPEWYSYKGHKIKDWHTFYSIIFKFYRYEFRESDVKKI